MRSKLLIHSLFFVLGFTLIFSVFGVVLEYAFASASLRIKTLLGYVGGVIILFFGVYLLGWLNIPWLEKERRMQARHTRSAYLSSFIFGIAFGAGWSPCVGAILGAILTLAAVSPVSAFWLLFAYSIGIGIPFILAAAFAQQTHFAFIRRYLRPVQTVFGVILVALGVLILTNSLVLIAEFAFASDLFINIDAALASNGVGLGVAFVAGLASFLSPCVFPLLPAYLAYLGGLSVSQKQ